MNERIQYIDSEIRAMKYPNPNSVADKFGINKRTIFRDIEYMRKRLNAPIKMDKERNGYYYTNNTYAIPQIMVNEKEVLAISIIEKVLDKYRNVPYFEEIKHIFQQIGCYLPSVAFQENKFISFSNRPFVTIEKQVCEDFSDAIQQHLSVDITYEAYSKNGEITKRTIHPYILINKTNWYVVGFCEKRQDIREFALSRIKKYQITDNRFLPLKDFDYEQYKQKSFDWETGQKKAYQIKLLFSPYQARWISERIWHPSQKIKKQKDGSIILSMNVSGLNDIKKWILYHGRDVEVLEPENLRKEIIDEISRMKEVYNK